MNTTQHHYRWKSPLLFLSLCLMSMNTPKLQSDTDLFMRDYETDDGTEPSNPPENNFWSSPDIWVLKDPDPDYTPSPFVGSLPWTRPSSYTLNEVDYRSPVRFTRPNWVYVKITNRGTVASTGFEQLKLNYTKASTNVGGWGTYWEDYLLDLSTLNPTDFPNCASQTLPTPAGEEITKPRRDAALVSEAERDELINVIIGLNSQTDLKPNFYDDGTTRITYWRMQQIIHDNTHNHCGSSFLPWHRELINRFENLLRKNSPFIKLHYWDWTTDPRTSTGGRTNLFTTLFMGNDQGVVISPFPSGFLELIRVQDPITGIFSNVPMTRGMNPTIPTLPTISSDATILANGNASNPDDQWLTFRRNPGGLEAAHNAAHGYLGGNGAGGNQHQAFKDPFVYILHSNADRLFSTWQRNPAFLNRLVPFNTSGDVYGSERETTGDVGTCNNEPSTIGGIKDIMEPWSGFSQLFPWSAMGGDILVKNSTDPEVVSPPVYEYVTKDPSNNDITINGVLIPVLQPGESVVIQIPWYPPDPGNFSCMGAYQPHFCLLARIISPDEPLTLTGSGSEITLNNGVSLRNINVVDSDISDNRIAREDCEPNGIIINNLSAKATKTKFQFRVPEEELNKPFLKNGMVTVNLPKTVYERWVKGGRMGKNMQEGKFTHMSPTGVLHNHSPIFQSIAGGMQAYKFQVTGTDATLENIELSPKEQSVIGIQYNYHVKTDGETKKEYKYDVVQSGTPESKNMVVGGATYVIESPECQLPDAGPDVTIGRGCFATLTATSIADASYTWFDNATGILVGAGNSVTVSPNKTTTYELMSIAPNCCVDFDVVTVFVDLYNNAIACIPAPGADGCFREAQISPNPVGGNELLVKFMAEERNNFDISLSNMQGRVLVKENIKAEQPGPIERILRLDKVPVGVYQVIIKCKEKIVQMDVTRM